MTDQIFDGAVLDYRSKKDCLRLANALLAVESTARLCAFIVDNNLMRPQWWVRALLAIIRKRKGSTEQAWQVMENANPGAQRDLVKATANWIVTGKDKTTRDAAGGFNRDEMKLLVGFLILEGAA